ncbi:MAG: COX15/CtaA family protein [Saprospirales bacterium]|nr:COX15/CtaA family protein [Saprospirales bacterium]MBK8921711.1 COX15/CtaA family protein [Saprospirales bacterium]
MAHFSFAADNQIPRAVRIWLVIGVVMVLFQVLIGGVTRLTGSGLSITRWEIVTGSLPPLSEAAWQEAFDLYKATPQYQKINQGMSIGAFQFIYFWEYFHRLWARLMFFVFILPFGWFLWKGMLSRRLLPRLVVVVLLAGLEGFFGWIMVASGLIQRPWVNAYNLTLHLCMALVIFSYLLWITFIAFQPNPQVFHSRMLKRFAWTMVLLAFFQIALGAMMSGTKAGLFYPTWPDMNGSFLPAVLLDFSHWTPAVFMEYDTNPFMPALIQFLHRNTAYLLTIMALYFSWRVWRMPHTPVLRNGICFLGIAFSVQVLLGILTLINCVGTIPVVLGVLHQAGAVALLGVLLFVVYQVRQTPFSTNVDKESIISP